MKSQANWRFFPLNANVRQNMHYWIYLRLKNKFICIHDSYLQGIVPARVVDLCKCTVADDLGLCKLCTLNDSCHIIGMDGTKYCISLFHDTFKPKWKIRDIA